MATISVNNFSLALERHFRTLGTPQLWGKVALRCEESAFAVPNFQKFSLRGPASRRWTTLCVSPHPTLFFLSPFLCVFLMCIFPIITNMTSRARLYFKIFSYINIYFSNLANFTLQFYYLEYVDDVIKVT